MKKAKIGAIIALDGEKEFNNAMTNVAASMKNVKSEGNLLKEQFAGQSNSLEALRAKHQNLQKVLETLKQKEEAAQNGLAHAKQSYESVGNGLKLYKKQLEEAEKKLSRMVNAENSSQKDIEQQKEAIDDLNKAILRGEENYQRAENRIKKWETALNNTKASIEKANHDLEKNASYMLEAEKSSDGCATSIDKFGKKTKYAEQQLKESSKAMETLAGVMISGGVKQSIEAVTSMFEECANAADDFESSIAKMSTIADTSKISLSDIQEQVMKLSGETGEAAANIANIAYDAISATGDTVNSVKLAGDATKLATAGFTTSESALSVLTTAMNSYKMDAKEMTSVSDSLVQTQNLGVLTIDKLSGSMGKAIATASAYNVDLYNLEGSYVSLTKSGIGVEESTTYIAGMLSELGKSGSTVSKVLQSETGKTFGQLMKDGNSLADVLKILNDSVDGDAEALMNLWSSQEAGKASNAIINQGINVFNNNLDKLKNSIGATNDAYAKIADTSDYAKNKMNNSVQNMKIAIGDQLNNSLKNMYKSGTKAFEWATDIVKKYPGVVTAVESLTVALGAMSVGFAGFLVIPKIVPMLKTFTAAMAANPIFLVATALSAVIVAVESYKSTISANDETRQFIDDLEQTREEIKKTADTIKENADGVESEWAANQKLVDKLYELNDVQEKTSGQKAEMKAIVDQLSEDIPELAEAYDAETGAMRLSRNEITELIKKRKEYALAVAAEDSMKDIAKNITDNELAIQKATQELKDAKDKYKQIAGVKYGEFVENISLGEGFELRQAKKDIEDLQEQIGSMSKENEEYNEQLETAEKTVRNYGDSVDAIEEELSGMEEAEKKVGDVTAQMTEEQAQAYEEMQKSIESSIENTVSLFDKFDGGDKVSADKMLENLKSQVEGVTKWSENMKTLAAATGQGMTKAFYDQLIQIGPSGANAVQELVDTLQNKTEKFTEICNEYTQAFDLSGISDTIAGLEYTMQDGMSDVTQAAETGAQGVNSSLKEIGDSDIYEALRRAFTVAAQAAGQSGNVISAQTSEAFENAVKAAQGKGTEISQTFVDELASGKVSIQDAIGQLNSSISAEQQKTSENSEKNAKDSMNSYGEGVKSEKQNIISATQEVFGAAKEQGEKAVSDFYSVGSYMGAGIANGLRSGTVEVKKAALEVSDAAVKAFEKKLDIHSPSRVMDRRIGVNITRGISKGVLRERAQAVKSVADICSAMLAAAETELEIHSPSRKFRDRVGANIGKGIAFGIKDTSKKAIEELRNLSRDLQTSADTLFSMSQKSNGAGSIRLAQMAQQHLISANTAYQKMEKLQVTGSDTYSKQVYKSASSWYKAYKKVHVMSLDDEKYFWKQVAGAVKKGTTGYTQALEKSTKIDNFQKKMKEKIKSSFSVSEYTTNSKGEQEKKSAETYYSEIYSKASKYFENYEVLHNLSLQQEEYYWQQVQKKMKKGTQAYYDATKKLKSVQSQIKTEVAEEKARQKQEAAEEKQTNRSYALSGGALSSYKTYFQVSAKAEYQYWDIVRKKFKAGTAERIEADQKYLEAKESYNEQLEQLNQDYYDNCKEVQDKLKEDIQDLTDEYKSAVSERKDSIYSSFNLFDQFESTSKSGKTLLYNLKTQVAGYADWEQQLSKLGQKGVLSDGLMKELQEMGPQASASIHALNQLSVAELKEYDNLWKQKNALSESQAVKENETLKDETQKQIDTLKAEAQKELNAYKKEYDAASKELKKSIEKPLKELAQKATTIGEDTASSLIAGIKKGATKKETTAELNKVNTTVSKKLGKLKTEGKTIGDQTLQGIIDGLTNKKKIDASAQELISALRKSLQKAADIHSPSRLFRKDIGANLGEGVNQGLKDKIKTVSRTGEDMIKEMLAAQKRQTERQQSQLQMKLADINTTLGVAELNNLISVAPIQNVNATVDNTDMLSMMQQMMAVMAAGFENMSNMQMVTDTGALVGETSAQMSAAFAMNARRLR